MKTFKRTLYFILISCIITISSCAEKTEGTGELGKNANHFNQIRMKLLEDVHKNGALIIYGTQDKRLSNENKNAALEFTRSYFWFKSKVLADSEVTNEQLQNNSVLLFGSYNSNRIFEKLNGLIPVRFSSDDFEFENKTYSNNNEWVTLFYHNPFNSKKLLFLVGGNSDSLVLHHLKTNMAGDIRISNKSYTELLGFYKLNNNGDWVVNRKTFRDFKSERKVVKETKNYRYITYSAINDSLLNKIISTNESSFVKVKDFIGTKFKFSKTNFYIFSNFEDKGLITNNTNLSNIFYADSSIHVTANDWINGDDFSKCADLLFLKNFPKPKLDFINEGLSIYFSDNWRERGFRYWAAKIALSGNAPSLVELLNNERLQFISTFITQPLSGMFIEFLISKLGKENFLQSFPTWDIDKNLLVKLNFEWRKFLLDKAMFYKEQIDSNKRNFQTNIPGFQKGFCFAHVGYQIYNGYLSRDAFQSLKYIHDKLNSNSFSITPFTSMGNANSPEPLRFWEFAGAENDESLIYLKHCSDELNMTVMMKPQIYLGQRGWPGDIEMKSPEDWKTFFHNYYNWIIHYAMISEIYKIPILCIGNELSQTTEEHQNDWINLIAKIRKLYSGKIVYAANWGGEFEKINFWDKLDYIGLSEYYPLSDKNNPSNEDLLNGAEKIMKRIEAVSKKYNKPVIFTEAGFRSSLEPWKTAQEGETKDSINYQNQSRCYNAVFQAVYNQKWLTGIYWWKWPSYLSFKGRFFEGGDLYPPNGKPVEKIIADWYSKKWK